MLSPFVVSGNRISVMTGVVRATGHRVDCRRCFTITHLEFFMKAGRFGAALFVLVLAGLPAAPAQEKSAPASLVARCDRDDAIYPVGAKAKFVITSAVAGEATYRLSDDGVGVISEGKLTMKPGEGYSVTSTFAKPGFVQLYVTQGKSSVRAAAAFDPTQIEPTAKMPSDFDA